MVDKLLAVDEESACAQLVVASDNIFVENRLFVEAGIVEHIAQTCAAGMGFVNRNTLNNKVKIGFLSAIRNLAITRLPKVGETLTTHVSMLEHVMEMALIAANVKIGDETIAEGAMKIFITDIENENNS
ncbi:MAG: hypothetical protein LBV02_03285 [Bacteroidales bacterium]|jgi:predicted hotdog family 3-hydroxylacyl-ACP dehydratase|nr:hypothetical protein [Bacteroidales bacterium]